MSASLVGSEMCIRDRSPTLPARLRPELAQRANRPSPQLGICKHRSPTVPVSYTHLTLPTICSV
eukprot:1378064-Alexandrium_andersonii.AAC.1